VSVAAPNTDQNSNFLEGDALSFIDKKLDNIIFKLDRHLQVGNKSEDINKNVEHDPNPNNIEALLLVCRSFDQIVALFPKLHFEEDEENQRLVIIFIFLC